MRGYCDFYDASPSDASPSDARIGAVREQWIDYSLEVAATEGPSPS